MDAEIEHVRLIKDRHSLSLLSRRGVSQVGVGWKTVSGKRTEALAIVVEVCRKMPESWLPPDELIPWQIEGVPVDIREANGRTASARTVPLADHKKRWRPAPGGVSVGHYKLQGAGTLGAWQQFDDGRVLMISCWHVIANCGDCKKGDPILQPAVLDGGRYPEDVIAYLEHWVDVRMIASGSRVSDANVKLREFLAEGREVPTNKLDVALARPVSDAVVTNEILGQGPVRNDFSSLEPTLGQRFLKSGTTTGATELICSQLYVDAFIKYPGLGIALFVDTIGYAEIVEADYDQATCL